VETKVSHVNGGKNGFAFRMTSPGASSGGGDAPKSGEIQHPETRELVILDSEGKVWANQEYVRFRGTLVDGISAKAGRMDGA